MYILGVAGFSYVSASTAAPVNQDNILAPGIYYVDGYATSSALEDDGILIVAAHDRTPGIYVDKIKIGTNSGHIAVKHATVGIWKQVI